jgi:hypothetical protein
LQDRPSGFEVPVTVIISHSIATHGPIWRRLPTASALPASPATSLRARRVTVLLAGIIVLSLGDLMLTVTYLQTIGLWEANPVARFVIEATNSPWALSLLKLLTMLTSVGILYTVRMHARAELASWCALAILIFMSIQWRLYADSLSDPDIVHALCLTAAEHSSAPPTQTGLAGPSTLEAW